MSLRRLAAAAGRAAVRLRCPPGLPPSPAPPLLRSPFLPRSPPQRPRALHSAAAPPATEERAALEQERAALAQQAAELAAAAQRVRSALSELERLTAAAAPAAPTAAAPAAAEAEEELPPPSPGRQTALKARRTHSLRQAHRSRSLSRAAPQLLGLAGLSAHWFIFYR